MTRLGIIGCGYWGPNYLRNFTAMDGVEVAFICDRQQTALDRLKKHYRDLELLTDFEAALKKPNLDAVVISTPAHTHFELTRKALAAGKHVLVEKPMAMTTGEAETLHAQAQSTGKTLMVGHTFLYNPAIRKMKALMDAGTVGKAYYLQAMRTHLGLIRSDVNTVWDLAPHDVAIFNYLLGKTARSVSAVGVSHLNPGFEDAAFLNLFYDDGVLGHIHISWVDANKSRQVAVIGSRARILFDDLNALEKIRIYEKGVSIDRAYESFGEFQMLLRDGDIISPKIEPEEPLRNVCAEFIHCVKTGQKPLSDSLTGLEVVRAISAIQESIRLNGQPVSLS